MLVGSYHIILNCKLFHAHESHQRHQSGIVAETQVRCTTAPVFESCIRLGQKVRKQVIRGTIADIPVLCRIAALPVQPVGTHIDLRHKFLNINIFE